MGGTCLWLAFPSGAKVEYASISIVLAKSASLWFIHRIQAYPETYKVPDWWYHVPIESLVGRSS